jgi:hypothetical protein
MKKKLDKVNKKIESISSELTECLSLIVEIVKEKKKIDISQWNIQIFNNWIGSTIDICTLRLAANGVDVVVVDVEYKETSIWDLDNGEIIDIAFELSNNLLNK